MLLPSASPKSPLLMEAVQERGQTADANVATYRGENSISSETTTQAYQMMPLAKQDGDCFMGLPLCREHSSWCESSPCSDVGPKVGFTSCLSNQSMQRNNHRNSFLRPLLSQRYGSKSSQNPTEATDKLLSAELKRLTLHEREKVTEDIHGVGSVIEETPEFVRQIIEKFDVHFFALIGWTNTM